MRMQTLYISDTSTNGPSIIRLLLPSPYPHGAGQTIHNRSLKWPWAGYRSQYNDWLRAGRAGDRIAVRGARFSAHFQTDPGAHPASCRGHERVELYLYSPYGPYGLYRASVPVKG
jgi:hypothetical protein